MGDFIRYIDTGSHELGLNGIEAALKAIDPAFSIFVDQAAVNTGDLIYASEVYGEFEVNLPGDQVFIEDLEDLRDELEGVKDAAVAVIQKAFETATSMIALQLTEAGHEHYGRIDPLWDGLLERYGGLLQIDEEGYYDQSGQILATG